MELEELKDLPLIDAEQLEMLVEAGEDGATELLEELLGLFELEARPQLESLKGSLAVGDHAAMVRPAHALAGSSANLGGHRLARLAKTLEAVVEPGHPATGDIPGLTAAIEANLEATIGAFQDRIAALRAS